MRISDWSSDVCSSDLRSRKCGHPKCGHVGQAWNPACTWNPASDGRSSGTDQYPRGARACIWVQYNEPRSEEHTSELQSLMRISYAVFCLKKKKITKKINSTNITITNNCKIATIY